MKRLSAERRRGKAATDGSVSERGGSEQGAGLRLAKSKFPLPDNFTPLEGICLPDVITCYVWNYIFSNSIRKIHGANIKNIYGKRT